MATSLKYIWDRLNGVIRVNHQYKREKTNNYN